jgi:hypothetical protein
MKTILLLPMLFLAALGYSEDLISVKGILLNKTSSEPIAYANIGFVDKGIGTVSSQDGTFELNFNVNVVGSEARLIISSLGFVTKHLSIDELKGFGSEIKTIYLVPSQTELPAVVIRVPKREYDRLGSVVYSKSELGYWSNSDALGGELATRIDIQKNNTRLLDFKFNVLENSSDSLLIRIKIYNCNRNMPGESILTQNIYHLICSKRGVETVSLKPYNIIVDEDIVVGIELVESFGDELYLSVSATPFGGTAYLRERSFAGWDVHWNFGLAFGLMCSYPDQGLASE